MGQDEATALQAAIKDGYFPFMELISAFRATLSAGGAEYGVSAVRCSSGQHYHDAVSCFFFCAAKVAPRTVSSRSSK